MHNNVCWDSTSVSSSASNSITPSTSATPLTTRESGVNRGRQGLSLATGTQALGAAATTNTVNPSTATSIEPFHEPPSPSSPFLLLQQTSTISPSTHQSPSPHSSSWRMMGFRSTASPVPRSDSAGKRSTLPKSALLMSKCQAFLKSSSELPSISTDSHKSSESESTSTKTSVSNLQTRTSSPATANPVEVSEISTTAIETQVSPASTYFNFELFEDSLSPALSVAGDLEGNNAQESPGRSQNIPEKQQLTEFNISAEFSASEESQEIGFIGKEKCLEFCEANYEAYSENRIKGEGIQSTLDHKSPEVPSQEVHPVILETPSSISETEENKVPKSNETIKSEKKLEVKKEKVAKKPSLKKATKIVTKNRKENVVEDKTHDKNFERLKEGEEKETINTVEKEISIKNDVINLEEVEESKCENREENATNFRDNEIVVVQNVENTNETSQEGIVGEMKVIENAPENSLQKSQEFETKLPTPVFENSENTKDMEFTNPEDGTELGPSSTCTDITSPMSPLSPSSPGLSAPPSTSSSNLPQTTHTSTLPPQFFPFDESIASTSVSAAGGPVQESSHQYPRMWPRVIETIRVGIVQLRDLAIAEGLTEGAGSLLSVVVRVSGIESPVHQSAPIQPSQNCIFGEEFSTELPKSFNAMHLLVCELLNGGRTIRQIGRISLKREQLTHQNMNDCWLPITRVIQRECTEAIGEICLDLDYQMSCKMFSLRVFDFTAWPLTSTSSSSSSSSSPCHYPRENPLQKGGKGRLYLKICISFGRSAFTAMKKLRVAEHRGVETIKFDCSPFVHAPGQSDMNMRKTSTSYATNPEAADWQALFGAESSYPSPLVTPTWRTGHDHGQAPVVVPDSPAPMGMRRVSSRSSFPFPPPSPSATYRHLGATSSSIAATPVQMRRVAATQTESPRLNIKVYNQPTYDDSSYCGFVRVRLENESMHPKDLPKGPNWFNIKSRTTLINLPASSAADHHHHHSYSLRHSAITAKSSSPVPTAKNSTSSLLQNKQSNRRSHQPSTSANSPSLFRHCSTPSTSSASTAIGARSPVIGTRSQPLRTTPSLVSLRGLLGGSGGGSGCSSANGNEPNGSVSIGCCCQAIDPKLRQSHASSCPSATPTPTTDTATAMVTSGSESGGVEAERIGEMRLRLWYNVDEVLPLIYYQPLYLNLVKSLNVTPYSASLISLIQHLPIDMEALARPLMKIFVHSNQIRFFFRLICSQYVSSCHDVNTLFRSQSLASRVLYEMMKFVGHQYLVISLKPLIDLIFAERKCCEIDPSKLKPGDSLEQNFRNITVYAELAFSRVVDSRQRCPHELREVFAELRSVVERFFPGREDVARLALSSFLIMRFFAAAILNPKLFALKREAPDADVSRTLVLVSKVLQRLANCVVSAHPLTTKEQWLTPVLARFSDDAHKSAMVRFLDGISAACASQSDSSSSLDDDRLTISAPVRASPPVNNENAYPIGATEQDRQIVAGEIADSEDTEEPAVLKHGFLVERRSGFEKKRSFKNLIHQKRRLVTLTDTQLSWQKLKDSGGSQELQQHQLLPATSHDQQKGQLSLAEITSVSALSDSKNTFRITTLNTEVHFQANTPQDMNEWIIFIQKQHRRNLMLLNRPFKLNNNNNTSAHLAMTEIDMERELQIVYSHLLDHLDILCSWKSALEQMLRVPASMLDEYLSSSISEKDYMEGQEPMDPAETLFKKILPSMDAKDPSEQQACIAQLHGNLVSTVVSVEQIRETLAAAKRGEIPLPSNTLSNSTSAPSSFFYCS